MQYFEVDKEAVRRLGANPHGTLLYLFHIFSCRYFYDSDLTVEFLNLSRPIKAESNRDQFGESRPFSPYAEIDSGTVVAPVEKGDIRYVMSGESATLRSEYVDKFTMIVRASDIEGFWLSAPTDSLGTSVEGEAGVYLQNFLRRCLGNLDSDPLVVPLVENDEAAALARFSSNDAPYDLSISVHEMFEAVACAYPSQIAVISDSKEVSYSELNAIANGVAHTLIEVLGSTKQPVGVFVERSVDMVAAIMGILKAGHSYLPLDPKWPSLRVHQILSSAAPNAVVTTGELAERIVEHTNPICVEHIRSSSHSPKVITNPSDLAYVIYTSGSTGDPKGVMVEHKSVANIVLSIKEMYAHKVGDRLIAQSPITFDSSVVPLFAMLCTGGTVILPSADAGTDARGILALATKYQIRWLSASPGVLSIFDAMAAELPELDGISSGGETLKLSAIQNLVSRTTVSNFYGPTETTVAASAFSLNRGNVQACKGSVPIGRPIQNYRLYVLDDRLNLQPVGCRGEICIGGVGVARGYLNAPELTANKFVLNPFVEGERLYRTGDIGFWTGDGDLVFGGRKDEQIKLRGFRIELSEIESVIVDHPSVIDAAVLHVAEGNTAQLVAFVSTQEYSSPSAQDITEHLKLRLPEYMVPSAIFSVDKIPLNSHGKSDKGALTELFNDLKTKAGSGNLSPSACTALAESGNSCDVAGDVGSTTLVEVILAGIWAEILRLDRVGIHDDFFELGGDSLSAVLVIIKMNAEQADIAISVQDIYKYRTVAEIVRYCAGG